MKRSDKGFVLPAVVAIVLVFLVLMPAIVRFVQQDTKAMVRDQKRTLAFNLAEAAIDRGMWKLKSSTSTFYQAKFGIAIAGYNFDTTYADIAGGTYRIKFSSGPGTRDVTIVGEGRDSSSNEIKAVSAVFSNATIPGAVLSGGVITWANAFSAHWGPILAHNNINITDANAAQDFFPRKYSRQVVQTTIGSYDRDTNGLALPNSDNTEWWSDYPVPELPVLDFSALRSSASITNTLNVYNCSKMSSGKVGADWYGSHKCNVGGKNHNGLNHLQNTYNHSLAKKQYVWYWDNDLVITGNTGDEGNGLWGQLIVRGNLTNYAGDNSYYTGHVPDNAWEEYAKISKSAGDTSAKNEYPADNGYRTNRKTFSFGGETWTGGKTPPSAGNTDVGFRGLIYVGGDFDIQGPADINGAVWVVGSISKATGAERTIVFYDDTLDLPSLNVVLTRESWDEIAPSATAWP